MSVDTGLPKIVQTDLVGDCVRLNSVLGLLQSQITTALPGPVPGSAAPRPIFVPGRSGGAPVYRGDDAGRKLLIPLDGSAYVVTDRDEVLYQWQVDRWIYVSGIQKSTQAGLAALASTLDANDTGLLVDVFDYRHVLQWNGSGFGWAPGDVGSGMIQSFAIDPNPTTGWKLCDGTANVPYLKPDGTTALFSTPNLAGTPAYLKFAGAVSGPVAATAPTLTNPTVSNAATGVTAAAAATGVTTAASATGISTGTPSATTVVQSGAGANVASSTHNHPITDPTHVHTINDPTHTHPITDPQHTHALTGGSVSATGEPAHYNLKAWFRQ